jgi:hypothetical protein
MATVENHGSIMLVRPDDEAEREWLGENTSEESQWFGGALVVEPRYLEALLDGLAGNSVNG